MLQGICCSCSSDSLQLLQAQVSCLLTLLLLGEVVLGERLGCSLRCGKFSWVLEHSNMFYLCIYWYCIILKYVHIVCFNHLEYVCVGICLRNDAREIFGPETQQRIAFTRGIQCIVLTFSSRYAGHVFTLQTYHVDKFNILLAFYL